MNDAVGVVVAIGVAIVAIIAIFVYIQISRFCENARIQLIRFVDAADSLEKNYANTLKKLGDAADEFSGLASELRTKIEIIDRDLSPLARNIDKTLTDANPLVKSLSESSEDLKVVVNKVRITASDAADIAEGIHHVVMPVVNTVRSLVIALSDSISALRGPRRRGS